MEDIRHEILIGSRVGISPIDILLKFAPDDESRQVILEYRENTSMNDTPFLNIVHPFAINTKIDVIPLARVIYNNFGLGEDFYRTYFIYESGLPRTELHYFRREILQYPPLRFQTFDFSSSSSSKMEKSLETRKVYSEKLIPIVKYSNEKYSSAIIADTKLDVIGYIFEGESDYVLVADNVMLFKYRADASQMFFKTDYTPLKEICEFCIKSNIDVIIFTEGLFPGLDRADIIDLRKNSFDYIRKRIYGDFPFPGPNMNTYVMKRMQENIYDVLSDIGNNLNPIQLRDPIFKLHQTPPLDFLRGISNLDTIPDLAPDTVAVLERLGIGDMLISEIIYPSGRPRTTLPFIRNIKPIFDVEKYRVLTGDANPSRCWLLSPELFGKHIAIEESILIPVVRYQSGMSRGLFFEEGGNYCGTFYYFEPTSEFYLKSFRTLIAVNKMTAYYYFTREFSEIYQILFNAYYLEKITKGNSEEIRQEIEELFEKMKNGDKSVLNWNRKLYAEEDVLDQKLCEVAKSSGIDVIVLASITGGSRMVTEVLDTRNRKWSFLSIFKKEDSIPMESDEVN